jgi:D-3-phosphoglycerate dehydrogenase
MSAKKVLFIDHTHPVLPERLARLGFSCEMATQAAMPELLAQIEDYFGVVIRSRLALDRAFFDAASQLKFVARDGVGTEHIDLDAAQDRGVLVFTAPEGSRDTVGEHAIGLLLSLLNHLSRADAQVRRGEWVREGNRGVELKGKTVGVLGYGNMGTAFARKLSGFDARVITWDRYKKDYGDLWAQEVSQEELFASTDILSIHIPYSADNHYYINEDFLQRFHKPIYLINTARGKVLHTADLVSALQSEKVLGAALDVIEYETRSFVSLNPDELPEPFQYLRASDRVVLSPHIAGWSFESRRHQAEVLGTKIAAAFGKDGSFFV